MRVHTEGPAFQRFVGRVLGGRFVAFRSFVAYIFPPIDAPLEPMPNYQPLVRSAKAAQLNAHAPYSGFKVGAALLTTSGKVYRGCNIESSSYSLTICAERTALFKAISEGDTEFQAIAVVSSADEMTPPCGACRQVLWDLAGNIDVVLASSKKTRVIMLKSLLPNAFDSRMLTRSTKREK